MKEKYIKLIDNQISKLSNEDFDLDAWKGSTKYVLVLIFGPKDAKVNEIENLKIDYSSWALRDSKSDYKPIETCKKKGKELLEIAKDELELFGVKEHHGAAKLKSILDGESDKLFDKGVTKGKKKEILKKLSKDQLVKVILSLITS
ncbi:MAG: hypothetical protein AAF731_16000 [Bacteroidota bacterium]